MTDDKLVTALRLLFSDTKPPDIAKAVYEAVEDPTWVAWELLNHAGVITGCSIGPDTIEEYLTDHTASDEYGTGDVETTHGYEITDRGKFMDFMRSNVHNYDPGDYAYEDMNDFRDALCKELVELGIATPVKS